MNNIIRKELKLKGVEFYYTHLGIINFLLPIKLTNMEIRVLSRLLHFRTDTHLQEEYKDKFRKYIRESLGLSSASLYNYFSSMYKKGAITDLKTVEVNILLIPQNTQEYYFRIKKEF